MASRWWFAIAIVAVCLAVTAVAAWDPRWTALLAYRRDALAEGQWWRLLTAHVLHGSVAHAVLDTGGLLLVAWIFGRDLGLARQLGASACGVVAVDAGLWFFHPEVAWYVGLSGALHAWFVAGAAAWVTDARSREKRAWGGMLLAGLGAKLLLEASDRAFWIDAESLAVVTAAHRWGAVGGAIYALASLIRRAIDAPVGSRVPPRRG